MRADGVRCLAASLSIREDGVSDARNKCQDALDGARYRRLKELLGSKDLFGWCVMHPATEDEDSRIERAAELDRVLDRRLP